MEAATLAVVRASRPAFRSGHDKLAFAVHAFLLADGFKLVATGAEAEDEGTDFTAPREEVRPEGWDSLDGCYAFRYQDTEGARAPLYVKAMAVGGQLLVHWAAGAAGQPPAAPRTLELDVGVFTTDAPAAPACYQRVPELVAKLRQAMGSAVARGSGAADAAGGKAQAAVASSSGRRGDPVEDPMREPHPGVSGVGYRPPYVPLGVGSSDVVPPGVRPPGYGGGPAFQGLMDPGPTRGGGMHVGPGDPIFGPGRMGGSVGGPPGHGSLPPGARWDPIAPPGMRGFHPDDFARDPSRPHPDMAQPGPGRGTDFDSMFG